MIKFVDESGSINCPLCTVLVSCTDGNVFLLSNKIVQHVYVFGKKRYVVRNVHQLLFKTRFFVLTKFSMHSGSHMDTHRIYDLTVVHLFKCIFNLGPRALHMLQAPRHLNPALNSACKKL